MTRTTLRPRRALAGATAGVLALTLAACGGGGKSSTTANVTAPPTARDAQVSVDDVNGAQASAACAAKVKTLRVTTFGAINDAARNGKRFLEQRHPGLTVELSTTAVSYADVVSQISADKAAGRTTDVAVAGYEYLSTFVNDLGAQELDPKLLRASYDQRFLPLGRYNGKQYGIPEQVSVPVLMYNATLLKKAGVDPATLKDTDGLLRAADALKKAGVSRPVDMPYGDHFAYWWLDTLAHSRGAGVQAANGQPAFSSPSVAEAMNVLAAVGKTGTQSNNPITDGLLNFGLQRSAIVADTVAAVSATRKAVATRGSQSFPIGVLPFPTLPGGTAAPVAGGNSLVVLSADQCQREMATEMVVALLSPDVLTASDQAASYLSIDKQTTTGLAGFYQQNPDLKALNDTAGTLVPPPTWPGTRGSEIPQVAQDAVSSVYGGKDAGSALADLQSQAGTLTR